MKAQRLGIKLISDTEISLNAFEFCFQVVGFNFNLRRYTERHRRRRLAHGGVHQRGRRAAQVEPMKPVLKGPSAWIYALETII